MTLRSLVCSIGVTGALVLATVTMTAGAAIERRSGTIPACEEVLTAQSAAVAMGEKKASILNREVRGSTRLCAYDGGSKNLGHSMLVSWGPYADARKQWASFGGIGRPDPRLGACKKLATAGTLRPNLKSFYGVEKALAQAGRTKWSHGNSFDVGNNPAFLWLPGKALAPLDQLAWVFVYVVKSAHLLATACTDNGAGTADYKCAIDAAGYASIQLRID